MDERRLEHLSRRVAAAPSRRGVLGALLGGVLLGPGAAPASARERAFGFCKIPGATCSDDTQCCAGKCHSDGACGCKKRGKKAMVAALCCSGKRKKGYCR